MPGPEGDTLFQRFDDHLRTAGLFPQRGRVLVAISGGLDSIALLQLLVEAAPGHSLDVAAAHVDHGISAASGDWALTVSHLTHALDVPLRTERLALGPDVSETVARRERYAALRRMQRDARARYLATAHHADDQVETVLHRFLRGSGPAGLAGIPARGPAGLVRPLLPFRRAELVEWLGGRAPRVVPVVDPANRDLRHDRSWVRERVLPMLRERIPDVDRRLLGAQRLAALDREAWASLVETDPELSVQVLDDGVEVARVPLRRYDKALSIALLRSLARESGLRLGVRRAERLLEFSNAAPSGRFLDLGERWVAETVFDRLRLARPPKRSTAQPPGAVRVGVGERGEARWRGWCITWRQERAGRARRSSRGTWVTPGLLTLRSAEQGERVHPLGGVGRRPVRRLLMEARVPRRERTGYPVVVRGTSVVWIPGVCRSDAALPSPGEPALRLDARRIGHP
jgi:tRNA(Ile)-lysidine synthase